MSWPGSSTPVFVKLLTLTALELQPEHRHSTANYFQLPVYYHYRLGGSGHGTWRELEAHRITNEWVLSGQCPHFPLLHGWRMLPIVSQGDDERLSTEICGNDTAIVRRVSAITEATSSAVLFLEHIPLTLTRWLRERLADTPDGTTLMAETEARVLELVSFVNDQGVLHMDVHFENVLTDGRELFLCDHGLAITREFQLDAEELAFFDRHGNFDRCTAITSNVHAVVAHHDSRRDWRQALRELVDGNHRTSRDVPAALRSYVARKAPVALAMGEFYRRLLNDLAMAYPDASLQQLVDDAR